MNEYSMSVESNVRMNQFLKEAQQRQQADALTAARHEENHIDGQHSTMHTQRLNPLTALVTSLFTRF